MSWWRRSKPYEPPACMEITDGQPCGRPALYGRSYVLDGEMKSERLCVWHFKQAIGPELFNAAFVK